MIDLNIIWFLLVGVLIIGYAILDGFDLGVGILHFFAKDDNEKRVNLNAVGPVWDGNEVWLLTGGGAIFAAFPVVYATVFSGFYLAMILLLFGLIARAVSFEFRKHSHDDKMKKVWDLAFVFGSFLPALLYGVAFGNILNGIPIGYNAQYFGNFFTLLNPFSVLVGLVGLFMFIMHGAIYMTIKSTDNQQKKMFTFAKNSYYIFVGLYIIATIYAYIGSNYLFADSFSNPIFYVLVILLLGSIIYIPIGLKAKKTGYTFTASSVMIATIILISALAIFPRLAPSSINLEKYSLTIYNASASQNTLVVMLIMALIGMPVVIGYSIYIYRVFKGKVILGDDGY
ncbi:MAG: cytochrome d ubiquinol oxidase subunit II [bacterium]